MTTYLDIIDRYGVTLTTDPHDAATVSTSTLPMATAKACVRDLEAIGIEASEAPDHDDPARAWLYIVEPEAGRRHTMTIATDAIRQSILQTEIVHIPYDAEAVTDLLIACDDSADQADGTTEYWGTDEDGQAWRIHVEAGTSL